MIIQCQSCSRKFIVKDSDIPTNGRTVQCGYCSVTWHQMPFSIKSKIDKRKIENNGGVLMELQSLFRKVTEIEGEKLTF